MLVFFCLGVQVGQWGSGMFILDSVVLAAVQP